MVILLHIILQCPSITIWKGDKILDFLYKLIVSTVHRHIVKNQNPYTRGIKFTSHANTPIPFALGSGVNSTDFKDITFKTQDSKALSKTQ